MYRTCEGLILFVESHCVGVRAALNVFGVGLGDTHGVPHGVPDCGWQSHNTKKLSFTTKRALTPIEAKKSSLLFLFRPQFLLFPIVLRTRLK